MQKRLGKRNRMLKVRYMLKTEHVTGWKTTMSKFHILMMEKYFRSKTSYYYVFITRLFFCRGTLLHVILTHCYFLHSQKCTNNCLSCFFFPHPVLLCCAV